MQKPILYLFVGYPGAGKTTVARMIHNNTGAVHIWTDRERQQMFGDTYSPAQSEKLYAYLNEKVGHLLGAGQSVVYDTNFNFYKDRQLLADMAAKHGADVKIVWLITPKELAKQRATTAKAGDNTRVFAMSVEDFERTADKCEVPRPNEHAIRVDGSDVSEEAICKQVCDL